MRTAKTDQTGRRPRLIWIFAGGNTHSVGFVMSRLTLRLRMTTKHCVWKKHWCAGWKAQEHGMHYIPLRIWNDIATVLLWPIEKSGIAMYVVLTIYTIETYPTPTPLGSSNSEYRDNTHHSTFHTYVGVPIFLLPNPMNNDVSIGKGS